MEHLTCENCRKETVFIRKNFGFGYTEYGSFGADHDFYMWQCQDCGALISENDVDEN